MPKYHAIYARCKPADRAALTRVAKHLRRSPSDTVRFLINTTDERIRKEIKRASLETPDQVTVSLTPAGEHA
jgi:hypothetical protein